ncbi:hypothetical protein ACQBAU_03870 [Propionibacteriaceae bacterium Y2011]
MNPVTIRRLLVAAVCVAGVATLYVLPTPANSPSGSGRHDAQQAPSRLPTSASGPQATSAPPIPSPTLSYDPNQQVNTATAPTNRRPPNTRRPVPTPPGSSPTAGSSTTGSASTSPSPSPTPTPTPSQSPTPTSPPTTPSQSPTPSPTPPPDTTPPEAPPQPELVDNNYEATTFGWPHNAAEDGVADYEVYRVNGGDPIRVPAEDLTLTCTESGCTAVVRWLDDETSASFFLVAVDSDGNRSNGSKPLEIVRSEEGGVVGPSSSPSESTTSRETTSQETPS